MSSSPVSAEKFKNLQIFWRSLERKLDGPCTYYDKRTVIKAQTTQTPINPSDELQYDENFFDDDQTKINFTSQLQFSYENQYRTVDLTDQNSSCSHASKVQNIQEEAELNFINSNEENKNPECRKVPRVSSENLLVDDCVYQETVSESENESESRNSIVNNTDSSHAEKLSKNSINRKSFSILTDDTEENDSEEILFDDNWIHQKSHYFILSFAGKPIFSLHRHGYEDKMFSLFGFVQCLISTFELRKDTISSIEVEGIKLVFLVENALYLVAASRENISTYHMKLKLREVYSRIVFLLTSESLNYCFEHRPGFDLRRELYGNFKLISNQLISKIKISNNIFTFFTNTVRVLPLHPSKRLHITSIIQKKCSKVDNVAFAIVIADHQLVAFVRLGNHTLHCSDLRLILNLLDCSENIFISQLCMLPICLPHFNKDSYLFAYISSLSIERDAFLILLAYNLNSPEEMPKVHTAITSSLHENNWFNNNCPSEDGNGLNTHVINIPALWHFMYIPKSSNSQLLCSKIIPPYLSFEEFKRLEAIYRDMHYRIHQTNRPLELIFEVKEKEVAVALDTVEAEIYAVFDPLVNTICVAKHHIDELVKWVYLEKKAYFIPEYPKF